MASMAMLNNQMVSILMNTEIVGIYNSQICQTNVLPPKVSEFQISLLKWDAEFSQQCPHCLHKTFRSVVPPLELLVQKAVFWDAADLPQVFESPINRVAIRLGRRCAVDLNRPRSNKSVVSMVGVGQYRRNGINKWNQRKISLLFY